VRKREGPENENKSGYVLSLERSDLTDDDVCEPSRADVNVVNDRSTDCRR